MHQVFVAYPYPLYVTPFVTDVTWQMSNARHLRRGRGRGRQQQQQQHHVRHVTNVIRAPPPPRRRPPPAAAVAAARTSSDTFDRCHVTSVIRAPPPPRRPAYVICHFWQLSRDICHKGGDVEGVQVCYKNLTHFIAVLSVLDNILSLYNAFFSLFTSNPAPVHCSNCPLSNHGSQATQVAFLLGWVPLLHFFDYIFL